MLTSSANQYLRPEYLTPLPTTLDAKKSPLALLAQTCSQIGADSPNTKSLIPSLLEKQTKSKAETQREKSSPTSSVGSSSACEVVLKSSFKPYETCTSTQREKTTASPSEERGGGSTGSSRVRTPVSSSKSNNTPGGSSLSSIRCESNHSSSSPRSSPLVLGKVTLASTTNATALSSEGSAELSSPSITTTKTSAPGEGILIPVSSPLTSTKVGFPSGLLPSLSSGDSSLKDVPIGATYKAGTGHSVVSTTATYLGGYATPTPHFALDIMGMASHQSHLKTGLNPYISYARMKTASGVDTLVPVCRDPYCTGCQLNSHLITASATVASASSTNKTTGSTSAGPCPGGCAQCDHVNTANKAVAAGFLPTAGGGAHAAAAAYAHAQLSALAVASHLPYVCSWIAGDTAYCGKRFSNSEELLQHLRTHTNLGGGSAVAGASDSATTAAALALLNPHTPAPTAAVHSLFHRTYPTPPLSPLATARYHPYTKPPILASCLGFPLHPHPGVHPYFPPYSLYGQRLGAASNMHP